MKPVNVGVIGVGHLGNFHAQAYARIPEAHLVCLYDADHQRVEERAREFGVEAMTDMDLLLDSVEAVSVAVPTPAHHRIATRCLEKGAHVLVEKPIATTLEEAEDLIGRAQKSGLKLQVGHIERFNPAFRALADMELSPMFIESHRLAPYTPRGADVAVILDLMIHDIDLILALIPGGVRDVEAAGVSVLSNSEDIANARVTFNNGAVANMTASRISAKAMRKMRLFQRDAYISADFLDRKVDVFRLSREPSGEERKEHPLGPMAQKVLLSKGQSVIWDRPQLEQKDALDLELTAFLQSVRGGESSTVSGEDGREALALALQIVDRLREHARWIQESGNP